jgi:hypothetical protein
VRFATNGLRSCKTEIWFGQVSKNDEEVTVVEGFVQLCHEASISCTKREDAGERMLDVATEAIVDAASQF